MFFSGERLKCQGCEAHFLFPVRDIHLYAEGDATLSIKRWADSSDFVPVLRQRAWCVECNKPTLAERVPKAAEFLNAAAVLRHPEEHRPQFDDELLQLPLETVGRLFIALSNRKRPPRCLSCGSTNWLALHLQDGVLSPKLIHDACGSELRWAGTIAGVVGKVKVRLYSYEGDLLDELTGVA